MLFCDRRNALSLDLRMMESLWLKEECNVGPMVELTSIIQGLIGPDSHKMSANCPTEVFNITQMPDAFIVRHGELIGVFIDEERITLRSVLENNRFVMELDPPCSKGSLVDYAPEGDRFIAFSRSFNRLYTYDLRVSSCVAICEVKALPRDGGKHIAMGYCKAHVFFCFDQGKYLDIYDTELKGGISSSQARRVTSISPVDGLHTIAMACRAPESSISLRVVFCDDVGYESVTLTLTGTKRPQILKKKSYTSIGRGIHEVPIVGPVAIVGYDSVVMKDRTDSKHLVWRLVDLTHKTSVQLPIVSDSVVTFAGRMSGGVVYVVRSVPIPTIWLLHCYEVIEE
ncbi:hypothetical protein Pmar_PMAR027625 [Perkinsus marinus ATCC 50983]|uniref:Uncharacterized protein n=1 Tax=Perkinsus marinus (strain ATCC 50983 / TXsc) TaxID=423536 RepID=C5KC96_PERM5|nr:hypothetical protein Pmar_PMAR027625 [Perkinsus marinus ATCC 50983]EER17909.1 hypothetical protein Pmar_PMAR027625 [Perkinsus marinus ATCC 50983]|eukprot:XP_002786113.1 hypothetical protein Pmar_PMAR027625 [Perkinsus marinus ATCC 50983]